VKAGDFGSSGLLCSAGAVQEKNQITSMKITPCCQKPAQPFKPKPRAFEAKCPFVKLAERKVNYQTGYFIYGKKTALKYSTKKV
jgi:hypothetical protein